MGLGVRVMCAKDLVALDPNGTSDPYYVIGLANTQTSHFLDVAQCVRSKTQFCTLNPVWNKDATFNTKSQSHKVRIEIWDKDHAATDDFLGYALLDVDLKGSGLVQIWLPLLSRSTNEHVTGEILVCISYKFHPLDTSNTKRRNVRLFLSSTMQDLGVGEKEAVVWRLVVRLGQVCFERGTFLTFFDMKHGVTEEIAKDSLFTLSVRGEEENVQSYFVGIVGKLYGSTNNIGVNKWINEYITNFRTELEALHKLSLHPSALPQPHEREHSFFYLRDPYITSSSPNQSAVQETVVTQLKEKLQGSTKKWGGGIYADYKSPSELEELILAHLKASVERDFSIVDSKNGEFHEEGKGNEDEAKGKEMQDEEDGRIAYPLAPQIEEFLVRETSSPLEKESAEKKVKEEGEEEGEEKEEEKEEEEKEEEEKEEEEKEEEEKEEEEKEEEEKEEEEKERNESGIKGSELVADDSHNNAMQYQQEGDGEEREESERFVETQNENEKEQEMRVEVEVESDNEPSPTIVDGEQSRLEAGASGSEEEDSLNGEIDGYKEGGNPTDKALASQGLSWKRLGIASFWVLALCGTCTLLFRHKVNWLNSFHLHKLIRR